MKEQVKELRVKIDGLAQLTKELKPMKLTNEEISNISFDMNGEKTITHLYMRSKEVEKAYDSLILAKAWLGKVLGELGTENPYKSGYKTKDDIEPTADVSKIRKLNSYGSVTVGDNLILPIWGEMNHIEKVDFLRREINIVLYHFENFMVNWSEYNSKLELKLSQGKITSLGNLIYQHLCEARFWLGFELERIKNNSNGE